MLLKKVNMKHRVLQPLLSLLVVLVLLSNVACTDSQLTNLSKALNDVALGMGSLQTTVIAGNKAGAISDTDTETILRLCFRINAAGQEASKVTRSLTKLDAASASSVLAILKPVLDAVNESVASGTLGIKDPQVKSTVTSVLITIQTALNTAQVILAARGGK
jgi:hypothetical protein